MENLQSKIISLLKEDARLTAKKIAVMLGASEKAIEDEISSLEKSGTIVKYVAITNEEKMSSDTVEALIEIKVSPSKQSGFDAIAKQIGSLEEVKSLYLISGAYDLSLRISGTSLREVASFVSEKLSGIEKVLSCATHFILKKYKVEGILLTDKENNKRLSVHP